MTAKEAGEVLRRVRASYPSNTEEYSALTLAIEFLKASDNRTDE